MLNAHYEIYDFLGENYILVKFSSGKHPSDQVIGNTDHNVLKAIVTLIKQIPSSKRTYDPVYKTWTIPEDSLLQLKATNLFKSFLWPCLMFAITQPLPNNSSSPWGEKKDKKSWAEDIKTSGAFKVEEPEEFFKNQASAPVPMLTTEDLTKKLSQLIKPYVNFELVAREDYLRGYKIAARRLHPDVAGGSSAAMLELNSLFAQYKESVS